MLEIFIYYGRLSKLIKLTLMDCQNIKNKTLYEITKKILERFKKFMAVPWSPQPD